MADDEQKHVFVSYIRENSEEVDKFCDELTKHGVHVWLDRNKIQPGVRWKDAIRNAIRRGDFFIACFSKEYTSRDKSYMNEELTFDDRRVKTVFHGSGMVYPGTLIEM